MKQKIIAVVFLLAAATTGLSFAFIAPLNSVNASSQQDCEAATSDCTVAEQRDYCREAYPNNEAGWYKCITSPGIGTPNTDDNN